ncbi:BspA family leucine-rich repeat surface protein [Mycoplasmopsis agalactiae]|uniref:BspA family leucine-rich repeat surface protein n=1 Tax=Mycoplasmopsis agalactiae TaxID=2110 RepID=UPI002F41293F
MDAPIAPPVDPGKDNPEKTDPNQNEEVKVLKTDISKLKLQTNHTNNTTKKDILNLLKKQDKLNNLTESDFDFKLEKKALLNREGEISITSKPNSKLISGTLKLTIDYFQEVTPRKHKYSADKTEVLEIGYDKYGQIEQFGRNVKKVPEVLPEEVISLESAFDRNWSGTIQGLDKWDTSNVENMRKLFFGAVNFNTDISNWKTDKVNVMDYMFSGAKKFNKDLASWNVDNVSTKERMFENASKFNSPIFKLVNPNVRNMQYMFYNAKEFNNSNISNWNTSSVTDIRSMFRGATEFNQNLNWKTENITNMSNLFAEASKFNGDITKWNTGNVVDMKGMFQKAIAFNKDISGWNIKKVKDVSFMFDYAYKFDHSLKKWEFEQGTANNNFANATKLHNNSDKLPVFKTTKAK